MNMAFELEKTTATLISDYNNKKKQEEEVVVPGPGVLSASSFAVLPWLCLPWAAAHLTITGLGKLRIPNEGVSKTTATAKDSHRHSRCPYQGAFPAQGIPGS